jgi:hypothetical protein
MATKTRKQTIRLRAFDADNQLTDIIDQYLTAKGNISNWLQKVAVGLVLEGRRVEIELVRSDDEQ